MYVFITVIKWPIQPVATLVHLNDFSSEVSCTREAGCFGIIA